MVEHQRRVQDKQQNCAAHTLTLTHTPKEKNHSKTIEEPKMHANTTGSEWYRPHKNSFSTQQVALLFCLLIHLVFFFLTVNRQFFFSSVQHKPFTTKMSLESNQNRNKQAD